MVSGAGLQVADSTSGVGVAVDGGAGGVSDPRGVGGVERLALRRRGAVHVGRRRDCERGAQSASRPVEGPPVERSKATSLSRPRPRRLPSSSRRRRKRRPYGRLDCQVVGSRREKRTGRSSPPEGYRPICAE